MPPTKPHRPTPPAPHPAPPPPKHHHKGLVIIGVVAIVVIALSAFTTAVGQFMASNSARSAVKSSKYQAVFLSNNMVYFGQISDVNDRYIKLKDIFYLQVQQQTGQSGQNSQAASTGQFNLTKLGNELHGPEDEMFINRDQVVFWENLKDNSKVSNAIRDYKSKNSGK